MAQASLDQPIPRRSDRSSFEAGVDRIWRFFTSVKIAAIEITVLALLVLVGTLRGSSVPAWIAEHLPFTSGLVDAWYAWDVFGSLLFTGWLTLISVAITICTINRAPGIWASIAKPTVTTTHGFLRNAEISATFAPAGDRETIASDLTAGLKKSRYRVLTAERNGEMHIYADRFHLARLGTFPFHLALILVLIGGIVSSRWGFRENEFVVPVGVTRDVGHDTGVSIRIDNFTDAYNENGVPKEYRSDLTLLKNGADAASGSITVNNPMTYGNLVIYQSGFGQAVHMTVSDDQGRVMYDDVMPLGEFQSATNPDAQAGVVDIPPAGVTMTVIGPDTNPANRPDLDTLQLRSGQMFVQLKPMPMSDAISGKAESVVDQGSPVKIGPYTVDFVREKRFTVLQVASNPGIPIFFAASFLLVAGLMITFYFPHRRIRGILRTLPNGRQQLALAPLARRDWSGKQAFTKVVTGLEPMLGAAVWTTRDPADERAARDAGRAVVAVDGSPEPGLLP